MIIIQCIKSNQYLIELYDNAEIKQSSGIVG